jgi:hypothetical protein
MKAVTLFVWIAASLSFAAQAVCDPSMIDTIASVEGHPGKPPVYPYIISFNSKKEAQEIKKIISDGWLDNRTYDCDNPERCVNVAKALVEYGVQNLDLGAYQFNYNYHKFPFSDYFDNAKAEERVCEYLLALYERYGWSWETLARYHSNSPKRNALYQSFLKNRFERLVAKQTIASAEQ